MPISSALAAISAPFSQIKRKEDMIGRTHASTFSENPVPPHAEFCVPETDRAFCCFVVGPRHLSFCGVDLSYLPLWHPGVGKEFLINFVRDASSANYSRATATVLKYGATPKARPTGEFTALCGASGKRMMREGGKAH